MGLATFWNSTYLPLPEEGSPAELVSIGTGKDASGVRALKAGAVGVAGVWCPLSSPFPILSMLEVVKFLPQNYTGLPIIYASSKELSANFTFLELTDLDKRLETSEVAHLRDGKGLVIVGV